MREPLPFRDHSAAIVYSEHFFEHLEYPSAAMNFLRESFRVLQPGGAFSVGVPDTEWPLIDYPNTGKYFQFIKTKPWHPEWVRTRLDHINYHFRQDGEHHYAYDEETLALALRTVGFIGIRRREFDPAIDAEARRVGTLYMTATKPEMASAPQR